MSDNPMFDAATIIGDLVDALRAEELNSDVINKIVIEVSPVIVRHVLKEV